MLNAFSRYQVFIGWLWIVSVFFWISHKAYKAPVMAPPAYAAAGDVYGSPNVTVAALPVQDNTSTTLMMLVQADGSTKTASLPVGIKMFSRAIASLDVNSNGLIYAIGSDRRLYESQYGNAWFLGGVSRNYLP